MRHLLVSFHSCPYEPPGRGFSGGMNVFLRGLLPALARLGVETEVLTRGRGDTVAVTRPHPLVRVFHLPCGWEEPEPTREGAWRSVPRFVSAARTLLGDGFRPFDVASAHYWMSGVAARALLGAPDRRPATLPLAFSFHTVESRKARLPGEPPDAFAAARIRAERELAGSVDALVCLSPYDLAGTLGCFPAGAPRGVVIPPGVEDRFRRPPARESARRALGLPAGGTLFLVASRPDAGKNVDAAIEAFRKVREAEGERVSMVVAGQDRLPAGGWPEGVIHAGAVGHDRMPAWYAAADATVCPSLYESFGLVPLESMAAGTPVVVPGSVYWGSRVRSEGGGIAYDPGRPGALEAALEAVARDSGLRDRLASECARVSAPFTWTRCGAAWSRLFSRLASPGGRPGTPRSRGALRRR